MKRILMVAAILGLLIMTTSAADAQIKKGKRFSKKGECKECHAKGDFSGSKKHEPFAKDDCLGCHKAHGLVGALRLKGSGKALCLECHDQEDLGLGRPNLHGPVGKGKCMDCHDPHASDNKNLLPAAEGDFCFTCHDAAEFQRKNVHEPLKDGCFSCHDVHGSENKGLLIRPKSELCAECHKTDSDSFRDRHAGYPVAASDCGECHTPHSGDVPNLLTFSSILAGLNPLPWPAKTLGKCVWNAMTRRTWLPPVSMTPWPISNAWTATLLTDHHARPCCGPAAARSVSIATTTSSIR